MLERVDASEHAGRLAYLERVVSPEPVLDPGVAALARAVADRYAGSLADVLRLAVPPRHARVEKEPRDEPARPGRRPPGRSTRAGGATTRPARRCCARSPTAGRPRAVWSALPGEDWAGPATPTRPPPPLAGGPRRAGRGARRAVTSTALDAALTACSARAGTSRCPPTLGPAQRYRRFLAAPPGPGARS